METNCRHQVVIQYTYEFESTYEKNATSGEQVEHTHTICLIPLPPLRLVYLKSKLLVDLEAFGCILTPTAMHIKCQEQRLILFYPTCLFELLLSEVLK